MHGRSDPKPTWCAVNNFDWSKFTIFDHLFALLFLVALVVVPVLILHALTSTFARAFRLRSQQTDERIYADEQELISHLDSLMDDDGQGFEKWAPAQAAIQGIIAASRPVEPAFYLDRSTWAQLRVPTTKHRDVRALRPGFDHGSAELVPFYSAPPHATRVGVAS